uniref:Fibronectin type-III domain-containing protein n=1 Tax=Panagrolaimus sp. PS1159 TaxID=55785 RepID=A0AC35G3P7_9BILA
MRILFFWIVFLFCDLFLETEAIKEKRCETGLEIRRKPNLLFINNDFGGNFKANFTDILQCTVINGDFQIANIDGENYTNADFLVFKNLQEITGKLLIFSTKGLTNLGHIFPNLKVIGGKTMVSKNSLIIYHNDDLRFIGLKNLKIIKNGGVRISDNPKLCFARSINWDNILTGNYRTFKIERNGYDSMFFENGTESCQDLYGCKVDHPEKCENYGGMQSTFKIERNGYDSMFFENGIDGCQDLYGCKVDNPEKCENYGGMQSCWEPTACQTYCPYHKLSNKKIGPGYPNDSHNCVMCKGYCPRKCQGSTINSIGEAMIFSKCSIIKGKLEISVQNNGQSAKAEEFTKAFGNIRSCHLKKYLQIRFSPTFTSLHMFKNLEIIHGEELVNGRYALSVMELENLRQLFSPEVEKKLKIKNGLVSFQNNNKLCYNRIMEFVSNIELDQNVTENDISKYSNGEKAICEEVPLHIKIGYIAYFGFRIEWKKFDATDMDHRKFLGYLVYHKKVDKIDSKLQIDDDRSECGDSWKKEFLPVDNNDNVTDVKHLVENLDPNSIYAYYVQTKTVHHPGARNAISKIGFVKTLFNTPEMPRLKKYEAIGPNKILLEWDPPIKPNGIITHYTVMWNAKSIGNNGIDPCGSHSEEKSSLLASQPSPSEDTCPADKGCCKCNDTNSSGQEKSVLSEYDEKSEEIDSAKSTLLMPKEPAELTDPPSTSKARTLRSIASPKQLQKPKELNKDRGAYPEIINENKTFGRSNISTTRVILSGLFHYTEYYIQIIACQDITVPENFCSKQAASRIIRTHPIPENDIIDLNTIKVYPYLINGTEQEDSRIISWKIPENPNGAILGFRYKISATTFEIDHKISKEDYEKSNGILIQGLQNGLYSAEIRTISSAGISEESVKKEFFKIHVFNWEIFFYKWLPLVVVVSGFIFVVCRFCMEKVSKKHTQKVIPLKEQKVPLL